MNEATARMWPAGAAEELDSTSSSTLQTRSGGGHIGGSLQEYQVWRNVAGAQTLDITLLLAWDDQLHSTPLPADS
jgi:hypothetical protein